MIFALLAGGGILAAGCQERTPARDTGGLVEGVVGEIMTHAAEEIKDAVADGIEEYFESGDFAAELGISGEKNEELMDNIKNYLKTYSADEEKLARAKEEVEALLENAQGLSVESIEEKLSEIFK